jgi:hypothetical protein
MLYRRDQGDHSGYCQRKTDGVNEGIGNHFGAVIWLGKRAARGNRTRYTQQIFVCSRIYAAHAILRLTDTGAR